MGVRMGEERREQVRRVGRDERIGRTVFVALGEILVPGVVSWDIRHSEIKAKMQKGE